MNRQQFVCWWAYTRSFWRAVVNTFSSVKTIKLMRLAGNLDISFYSTLQSRKLVCLRPVDSVGCIVSKRIKFTIMCRSVSRAITSCWVKCALESFHRTQCCCSQGGLYTSRCLYRDLLAAAHPRRHRAFDQRCRTFSSVFQSTKWPVLCRKFFQEMPTTAMFVFSVL